MFLVFLGFSQKTTISIEENSVEINKYEELSISDRFFSGDTINQRKLWSFAHTLTPKNKNIEIKSFMVSIYRRKGNHRIHITKKGDKFDHQIKSHLRKEKLRIPIEISVIEAVDENGKQYEFETLFIYIE